MRELLLDTKTMMQDKIFLSKAVRIALPVAMQGMLNTVVNLVDNLMIGSLGSTAIASVGLFPMVFYCIFASRIGISNRTAQM